MRYFLASLYGADYRTQVAAAGISLDTAPDVVDLECPQLGAYYVADLGPEADPWDLEALEWAALVRLDRACPDHPHQFVVGA